MIISTTLKSLRDLKAAEIAATAGEPLQEKNLQVVHLCEQAIHELSVRVEAIITSFEQVEEIKNANNVYALGGMMNKPGQIKN